MTIENMTADEMKAAADSRKAALLEAKIAAKAKYLLSIEQEGTEVESVERGTQYTKVAGRDLEFAARNDNNLMFCMKVLPLDGNKVNEQITDNWMITGVENFLSSLKLEIWSSNLVEGAILVPGYNPDFASFVGYARCNTTLKIAGIERLGGDVTKVASLKSVLGVLRVAKVEEFVAFDKEDPESLGDHARHMRNVVRLILANDLLVSGKKITIMPIERHQFKADGTVRQTAQTVVDAKLRSRLSIYRMSKEQAAEKVEALVVKKIAKIELAKTRASGLDAATALLPMAEINVKIDDVITRVPAGRYLGATLNAWTRNGFNHAGYCAVADPIFLVSCAKKNWTVVPVINK